MTITYWPEPEHTFACCQQTPWNEPDPECPGVVALERKEAA